MNFHYGETKNMRRAIWAERFSSALLDIDANYLGRIDWPSADVYFRHDRPPVEAAELYAEIIAPSESLPEAQGLIN